MHKTQEKYIVSCNVKELPLSHARKKHKSSSAYICDTIMPILAYYPAIAGFWCPQNIQHFYLPKGFPVMERLRYKPIQISLNTCNYNLQFFSHWIPQKFFYIYLCNFYNVWTHSYSRGFFTADLWNRIKFDTLCYQKMAVLCICQIGLVS